MSKHKRSVPRKCVYCGKDFLAYPSGKTTASHCSKSCASFDRSPESKKKVADSHRKPLVEKVCEECGKTYYLKPMGQLSAGQRFCSPSCSTRNRWKIPGFRENFIAKIKVSAGVKLKGRPQPYTAERMRRNNPTRNPETVEKIRRASKDRTFLARGGNGALTQQQIALCQALGLPDSAMEYVIPAAKAREHFPSLPPCYKVDLGISEVRLAIEVDGKTHKTKKWKYLDRRKTAVLNFIGWTVLRFWNEEVDQDLSRCVQMVLSTISQLKGTTTTSPMEY